MTGEIKTAPESMIYKLLELYARSHNVEITNVQITNRADIPDKKAGW